MRWDRLFDELEAQAVDLEVEERDVLAGELRDGDWAETGWRALLGGQVGLEVVGAGRVDGVVVLVNQTLVHLRGPRVDHVVSAGAVLVIHDAERRADDTSAVGASLGWGHVLRALRGSNDEVSVTLADGSVRDGTVDVVGRDFVRLRAASGRGQVVPFAGIAVVSGRT